MSLLDPFILPSKYVSFWVKLKRYFYIKRTQDSAGTITFYIDPNTNEPMFLQFYVTENGKTGEWWFPKGIVENTDANYEYRAIQETKEEVGLDVTIITELASNTYTFYWDKGKTKFSKTVHYFLAKSATQNVELAKYSSEEDEKNTFKEFTWSFKDTAMEKTNHSKEKDLLQEAFNYIKMHPKECC